MEKKDKEESSQKDVASKTPHHIHDRGYKQILSFVKLFEQLMDGYVPLDWKNNLDYSRSERLETSHIIKHLEERESDVLYKVPLKGTQKEIYLYILIEHQSTVDHSLAFRVLCYLVDVWHNIYKNTPLDVRKQVKFQLPPVFPIVLYNGEASWTAARSVAEMVEYGHIFAEFIPNVKYHLVDVPHQAKELLLRLRNTLAAVFLLEQDIDDVEFREVFREAFHLLENEPDDEIWLAIVGWVYVKLCRKSPEQANELFDEIDFSKFSRKEVTTMLETVSAKLWAGGKQEGMLEGSLVRLVKILKRTSPQLLAKYEGELNKVRTMEEFEVIEEKILQELEADRFKS